MGGFGSGGRNRISDEEKRRRGTFRADKSAEAIDTRLAAKVIAGPWLSEIPEPEIPLGAVGRKKYDQLTRALFEQNKLTLPMCMRAELAARLHEKIAVLAADGKFPSASDMTQLQRALDALQIAEGAKPIASPDKRNKFETSGFSNRTRSSV